MATGTISVMTNESGSKYCKMPDGTYIQWDTATINSGSDRATIGFTKFNGGVPVFLISSSGSGTFRVNNLADYYAIVACNEGNVSTNKTIYWVAIGRWK